MNTRFVLVNRLAVAFTLAIASTQAQTTNNFVAFPNNSTHSNASVMAAIANVPTTIGVVFDANGQTNDIQIWNFNTLVYTGPFDVSSTLQRIRNNQSVANTESDDGGFFNFYSYEFPNIPRKGNNYYMEFMVWPFMNLTAGQYYTGTNAYGVMSYPGAMRLIIGLGGEVYFTGDHYGGDGPQKNAYYLVPSPSQAIGNSWTNPASAKWENATNWNFASSAPMAAPSNCDPADLITNASTKTVTLDAFTAGYQTNLSVLAINNLVVSAPAGSVNTLLLTSGFTNTLQIATSFSILGGGSLTLAGGTISSGGTYVTNNQTFFVGDGTHPATFQLNGGFHDFNNGIETLSNAVLAGCGTITGSVVVDPGATILASCGGTLSVTAVVTNNGSIVVTNATTINFYGPMVNNGLINSNAGTVQFSSTYCPLTVATGSSPSAGGTATGGGTVACGSNATVCATANSCYQFLNWTLYGNVVSTSPCYTFPPASNVTVVANFSPLADYTIATSGSPAGGGTTSGDGTYACGDSVTVCATASVGYVFTDWTANSSVVSGSSCYTFVPNANETLVANFAPFQITAISIQTTNVLVTWEAPTGSTNALQATPGINGGYSTNGLVDIFAVTNMTGTATNFLDINGATNQPSRYYRVRLVP
jgi:hypothetical protein